MTTLTVTSLENDVSNTGSLVYAISQANSGLADSIVIDSSLNGKTFDFSTLTSLNGTAEEQLTAINVASGTLVNLTGTVTATASGEAAGVARIYTGSSGSALTLSGLKGTITAESADGDAFGVLSRAAGNYSYQQTYSTLTADGVGGHITVTASGTAAGVYSLASTGYYYSSATSSVSLGDVTGDVTVTGGSAAYGLYSRGHSQYSASAATLTVGDVTGHLSVTATDGDAYGMYSSDKLTIAGDIGGDVFVSSDMGIAAFISGPNAVVGNRTVVVKESVIDETTGEVISPEETELLATEISGSIVVDGAKGAYGILAGADSKILITGTVAAGNLQGSITTPIDLQKVGYAYADGLLNGGKFTTGSSNDDLSIADGALVIGDIALGGGDNTLSIDSGAQIYGDVTADSLSLAFNLDTLQTASVITATTAGALASESTSWTINLADGIRSGRYVLATVEDGIDVEAMADVTATVNAFGEEYEITFADDMDKLGVMDINVTEFGEIEFIYADTFFGVRHNVRNGDIIAANNGAITLYFSRKLDESSFDLDMVSMTDGEGNAVAITGYGIDGASLLLEYDPVAVSGRCVLTISGRLKDVDGNRLDQNANKNGGEADDDFIIELNADGDISGLPVGKPENLNGTADGLTWSKAKYAKQYVVEYSTDNFDHIASMVVSTNALDSFCLPSATYQWRVQAVGNGEWEVGEDITSEAVSITPQLVQSDGNGNPDIIFVSVHGIWDSNYQAEHVGVGEWGGTGQIAALAGRNLIDGVYLGSDDASLLLLTDDANGDALFVDDIYSAFPEGLDTQARIAKINEIRAGAGDDIVDLTSQRFDYVGGGMTVRGGLGNDVIWANNGNNTLFGDAGDDVIVGAGGNDVIVGGNGDDSMHGGGGDDIFAFGGDWGQDVVEQLADGKVTLWFEEGDESKWDASTLTYTDGDKSVKVTGVALDNISLKFGDDGSAQYGKLLESGAFDEFSSEKIFEDKNKGILA